MGTVTYTDSKIARAVKVTVASTAAPLSAEDLGEKAYLAWLKAGKDNTGDVFIGPPGVTAAAGFPIAAGEIFGPIPISELKEIGCIGTAADVLHVFLK